MKNMTIAIIILIGALTATAQAQTSNSQRVLANIPFAFNVGKTTLPAGKYAITVVNPTSDRRVLQIRSADGRSTAMTLTTSVAAKASDDAKVVFHRYGDRYFFAQAHLSGEPMDLAALKSTAERAEETAASPATWAKRKKTVVVILAD
jgi:hypothetical protein